MPRTLIRVTEAMAVVFGAWSAPAGAADAPAKTPMGRMFYRALRANEVPAEMVIYPKESHDIRRPPAAAPGGRVTAGAGVVREV